MTVSSLRPVLAPQGVPEHEGHQAALYHLGADPRRVIDLPGASREKFIEYVSRLRFLDRGPASLVAFAQPNPLALALDTRRRLEARVPRLASAIWILLVNEDLDPFFVGAATELGYLPDPVRDVPVWRSRAGKQFLVVPTNAPPTLLHAHCAKMMSNAAPSRSGAVKY